MKARYYTTLALNMDDKKRTEDIVCKFALDNPPKEITFIGIYRKGLDLLEAEEGLKK